MTTPNASEEALRLSSVEDALAQLRAGRPVLVADDENRENEADIVMAGETMTAEWMAWAIRHSSGVICSPMPDDVADRLLLPPMVSRNEDPKGTAYTISVDAKDGVHTGISAADRALTLRLLADPTTPPAALTRPGHVFPLRARPGGVLERDGHTEASVDLCRLAGLSPVAMIVELVHDDGLCIAQAASISRSATLWGREIRTHCTNPTTTRAA